MKNAKLFLLMASAITVFDGRAVAENGNGSETQSKPYICSFHDNVYNWSMGTVACGPTEQEARSRYRKAMEKQYPANSKDAQANTDAKAQIDYYTSTARCKVLEQSNIHVCPSADVNVK